MVKKLFKHEFNAWLRSFWLVFAVILTLAGSHRIFQFFENDSTAYEIANVLTLLFYSLSVLFVLAAPTFFAMNRFHKNLFTGEGYLTLTLPVTAGQHLWVKVLTATAMSVMSFVVCLLSVLLITAGDVFVEVWKAIVYLLRDIPTDKILHVVLYCLEVLVLLVVGIFSGHFLYDTCICLGQRFRKNRVAAAIGIYFAYYYLCQILSTIFGVVVATLEEMGSLQPWYDWLDKHPVASVHVVLAGCILLAALQGLICFAICHRTISKKLNLE